VRDARFRIPADLLSPVIDVPSLKLVGSVTGTLAQVTLGNGWVSDASGNARWSEAGVTGSAEARFSDILAEFASQPDGSISGTVADDGRGNLEVNGQFKLAVSGFNAEAFLSARNDDVRVQEALRYVGQPQADGSSHLVIQGQLFKLF
jgi:general secretion pathway protein N